MRWNCRINNLRNSAFFGFTVGIYYDARTYERQILLPVLSNCVVSVGEMIERLIKYQVNGIGRKRSFSLPRQDFGVKYAELKITVTSLLLTKFEH
jgi:hypothetical protein